LSWLSSQLRRITTLQLVVYCCTLVGALLVAVATATPTGPLQWTALLLGVLIGSVAPAISASGGPQRPDEGAHGGPRWLRRHWKPVTAVLAVIVMVAAAGLTYSVARSTACPPAQQLRLVTDPAMIDDTRALVAAYERSTAEGHDGCPDTRIYAYSATSDTVLGNLRPNRWLDQFDALDKVGPRPDIWLAETGHQVDLANQNPPAAAELAAETIARTPLVLAVPDGPATVDADPATWAQLINRFTDPTPLLVRGTANTDDLDMLATIAMYESEKRTENGLSPTFVEQRIQTAIDAGPFPAGDATVQLCHRRQLASPGSTVPPGTGQAAIVATEQEVIRYNRGTLGEAGCGPAGPTPEGHRLRALYPSDTLDQDIQFVELRWDTPGQDPTTAARAHAVGDFRGWLTSAAGKRAIVDLDLHAPDDGYPIDDGWGADPNASPPSGPVEPQRWQDANLDRLRAQQPSSLLFAVDSSGSMGAAASNGSRQQVAAAAILSGLEALGSQDEFGLWTFSTASESGHVDGVPIGLRDASRLAAADTFLRNVRSNGDTPLYRALVDGAEQVSRTGGPDSPRAFRAVVVLTDGEDTASDIGAKEAVEVAEARNVRIVLVTVGEVRCASAGLIALTASTGNRCVDADPTDPSRQVAEVVADLKGGRG
jgi:Ca-activated chloride channel family protein